MAEERLKPHVTFADGTFSIFKRIVPDIPVTKNGTTELYNEFYMRPGLKARRKWKITEKDEDFVNTGDDAGYYKKKYLKDYCLQLDPSPDSASWLLFCDYKGKPIDILKGMMTLWLDKMNTLRKQNHGLRATINSLTYEMIKLAENPTGYMGTFVSKISKMLENAPVIMTEQGGKSEGPER